MLDQTWASPRRLQGRAAVGRARLWPRVTSEEAASDDWGSRR
jgi:hypothetical protein